MCMAPPLLPSIAAELPLPCTALMMAGMTAAVGVAVAACASVGVFTQASPSPHPGNPHDCGASGPAHTGLTHATGNTTTDSAHPAWPPNHHAHPRGASPDETNSSIRTATLTHGIRNQPQKRASTNRANENEAPSPKPPRMASHTTHLRGV